MIDIGSRLATIKALLNEGTDKCLTYAALECRLTIELICYERLMVSYDYISYSDLRRKWQPKDVVQRVIEDANEYAASTISLSISQSPVVKGSEPATKDDYEAIEYLPLGTQIGFDYGKLGKLWNALSNLALHISLPKVKMDQMPLYADAETLKAKINETIEELDKLEKGNMLVSDFGPEYSFECDACQIKIKKKIERLKNGQVVSCLSPSCLESYEIHVEGSVVLHHRRVIQVTCDHDQCGSLIQIPVKQLERLHIGQPLNVVCNSCAEPLIVELVPCKRNRN